MAESKHDIFFNQLSWFVNMTHVTHEFTDHYCHTTHPPTLTSSPHQPSNTTPGSQTQAGCPFYRVGCWGESFFWVIPATGKMLKLILSIHTTIHNPQPPLPPVSL